MYISCIYLIKLLGANPNKLDCRNGNVLVHEEANILFIGENIPPNSHYEQLAMQTKTFLLMLPLKWFHHFALFSEENVLLALHSLTL